MIRDLGRRTGTAAIIAATITAIGAATAASAQSPPVRVLPLGSVPAAKTLTGTAAALPKSGGAGDRLSSRLAELSTPSVRGASRAEQARRLGLPETGPGSLVRDGSDVVVEARTQTTSPGQLEALRDSGARVLSVDASLRTVTLAVAPAELAALSAVAGVVVVTPALAPITAAVGDDPVTSAACPFGAATSEADQQLRAADARAHFGVDGTGVKVGVLSDSYNVRAGDATNAADDVLSNDLPGATNTCGHVTPVQVLNEGSGLDEGRAMLQVIHDLAPGASLAFNAAGTSGEFPGRVDALGLAGAKVIVDDVSYLDEPFFQDGPHAVAANNAAANNVAYYSSAANNNLIVGSTDRGSWEAPSYRPTACPAGLPGYDSCMNFGTAASPSTFQRFDVAQGRELFLDFQWAQPWNGVGTDLDLFLVNGSGTVIASSVADNTGPGGKPWEFFRLTNGGGSVASWFLLIARFNNGNTATPRVKWGLVKPQGQIVGVPALAPGDISGPAIFGHNGAPGAMSVAAVPFNNSSTIENFSSRGPVTHYFGPVIGPTPAAPIAPQVLAKPDLAATDGAQTTFFIGAGPPFRFFGTSEAAPHAAAVAALQFDAAPGANVPSVEAAQKSTATSVGSFGATAQGAGLVNAARAVGAMVDTFVPDATTSAASGVASTTATLGGTVNPRRDDTSYHFEYGPTTAYGSVTPQANAGTGVAALPVTAAVSGLAAGTTYHFRVVASNFLGSTAGADGVFTTARAGGGTPPPPPKPKPKVKLKLRGRTLTLTFSGGTFRRASVTIKKGKRRVAKASGRVRSNKFTVRLKRRLKKGRYALTIVLTDARSKKTTIRTPLKV